MNGFYFSFSHFYLFSLFIYISHSDDKTNPCTYATTKKPIGYYEYTPGYPPVQSYNSFRFRSRDICNNHCRVSDKCWATSFDGKDNCSFYNTSNFHVNRDNNGLQISQWKLCDMSSGHQPEDGRCKGLWVTYPDQYLSVTSYMNLANISTNLASCQENCLKESLCGFINYQISHCVLVPKWPYKKLNYTFTNEFNVLKWTCVDNYEEQITAPTKIFKPLDEKCTGHWTISSRNREVKGGNITGLFFQTQIYKECLDECNQYANCRTALYNITYSICVLTDISDKQTVLPNNETRFITFEWKCVKHDSHNPIRNEDEKRYESLGMKCYQIENNTHLFIGKDECGRYPLSSSFVLCDEKTISLDSIEWNIKESCLSNQTYWTFPATVVQMNISGYGWMNLTKIYTGIQQYWLAYLDDNNLREVEYIKCRSFNASRSLEKLKSTEIVSKEQWKALPPVGILPRYSNVPIYIDISASQSPFHSCKTRAACIDILRAMQVLDFNGAGNTPGFADIPYNFMIDESGNIYEGRGWKYDCAAVSNNNFRTLCIGYIGWFRNEIPKEGFLNSLKKLIEYSVDKGHVDKNYTLYIQQDLASSTVHRNLVIVIKNWYRYRGFIPEDCTNYSFLIILFNTITVLCILILLSIFHSMCSLRKFCNKCSFLKSYDDIVRQIFPCDPETISLNSSEPCLTICQTYCLIYQKSSFISSTNQPRIVKLIKIWFYNLFLETINSRHSQNTLNNYLRSFSHIKDCSLIYEVDLLRENDLSNCEDIILCVNDKSGLDLFKRLVKTRCCICCYFRSEHVNLTMITNNISFAE